ncbi:MAG: NINE protein [Saprospiraceae bacterium]|nr:NINE protein [Bacteroidia bacterium]NNE13381.1 NINE protein [Saprospiraceae bacterium]NNL91070.1 NINE protein [Saprospiraceae bacterium]
MRKSKGTAIALAFFGGIIGLHKFYLRDIGSGIFYLVLFYMMTGVLRFPLTAILGIIDAFTLIGMSQEKFDKKYNKNAPSFSERRTRRSRRRNRNYEEPQRESRRRREEPRGRYEVKKSVKRQRSNPFKKSAFKKYKEFDLEDAISDYKQALEIAPEDKEIHFYMGAVYSMLEKKGKSFFHLDKAIKLGFSPKEKILEMDEFAYLRIQPEFESFKDNGFTIGDKTKKTTNNPDLQLDDLLLSRLNKLKELRERGLLSEKEFIAEKEKIIRR